MFLTHNTDGGKKRFLSLNIFIFLDTLNESLCICLLHIDPDFQEVWNYLCLFPVNWETFAAYYFSIAIKCHF